MVYQHLFESLIIFVFHNLVEILFLSVTNVGLRLILEVVFGSIVLFVDFQFFFYINEERLLNMVNLKRSLLF